MPRCPECRNRFASHESLAEHVARTGHRACTCMAGGAYKFPHRPYSPYCEKNPMQPARLAWRAGASPEEVSDMLIEIALHSPGRRGSAAHCPF